MKQYVLDSFAMIALFRQEPGSDLVKKLLHQAASDIIDLNMSSINVGELYYMLYRKTTAAMAAQSLQETLRLPVQIHEPSLQLTLHAARLKATARLSFADAHAAALAIQLKAILITGDKEFESLKGLKDFKMQFINPA